MIGISPNDLGVASLMPREVGEVLQKMSICEYCAVKKCCLSVHSISKDADELVGTRIIRKLAL